MSTTDPDQPPHLPPAGGRNRPEPSTTPVAAGTAPHQPRRAIIAGLAAQTSGSVPISLVGATAPELQTAFGFGDAQLGVIAALYFISAAVLGPYGGRVVDRLGPTVGLRATGVIVIASLLVEANATSYPMLVVGALIGATSLAVATPASNVVLIHHVPECRRGLAFGLKQSAVPLAATLSGLALPLIALRVGWRWAFVVMLVFPLASLVLAPPTPSRHDNPRPSRKARPPRELLLLAGVGVFASTAVGTLSPFLVRAAIEVGYSTGAAGVLLSIAAASLIISRVMWGAVLDRSGLEPVAVVSILLTVGTVGYALLASSSMGLFAVGAVVAYSFGWAWPGVQFLAGVRLWPENPGEASGVLQLGAFAGATIGPLGFGVLVQRSGFGLGYTLSAAVAAIAAGLAALLARRLVSQSRRAKLTPNLGSGA
ncbi:MAG: MFS transporter [bacterium]|nr:MFS transporter [bacterium]